MRHEMAPRLAILSAVAFILATAYATAQPPAGRGMGMPRYDKATEITVSGTVDDVRSQQGCCGGGTHLTLTTPMGAFDVHLGPTQWLSSKQFSVAKGDTLDVTGSRLTIGGREALIAREVARGGTALTLRNADGIPLWARGGRMGR